MVDQPVDGGSGGHGVFEDAIPLAEDEVAGEHQAAAFVAFGQEGEEHFHLFGALLDVAEVVEDDDVVAIHLFQPGLEAQVAFGDEHLLDEVEGAAEVDGALPGRAN